MNTAAKAIVRRAATIVTNRIRRDYQTNAPMYNLDTLVERAWREEMGEMKQWSGAEEYYKSVIYNSLPDVE